MAQYAPATGAFTAATLPAQVGNSYNIGLSDGSRYYGYLFQNQGQQSAGLLEKTDVATKSALVNYGSPNLVDRDLAFYPRVTDGNFAGGGYQEVWIDPTKYFDSDLDPRIPGFLQLRPQWTRITKASITPHSPYQVVAFRGDFWYTFGEANGNIYSANGGATTTPVAASVISLATDGSYLYALTTANLYRYDGTTWVAVTNGLNLNGSTATNCWAFVQGTYGRFAYYNNGAGYIYKIDLTQTFPIAAANHIQLPLGGGINLTIQDLTSYQNGLAVLTLEFGSVSPIYTNLWFHDGTNMTLMASLPGYVGQGLAYCLGDLYLSAYAVGQTSSPQLYRLSGGSITVVAKPGSPFPTPTQGCLAPVSSGQNVFWPITTPSIKGISGTTLGVVLQYDALTGAVTHLPVQDTNDYSNYGGSIRTLAAIGDSVAICYASGSNGYLQYQSPAFGTIRYQSFGWLCSSLLDFSTPAIAKRFRRVEVTHAPLNSGESITVEAFVNQDPLAFTTSLTPTATATNSTLNSTLTALIFGADTVGKTMYFALKLSSSNQTTTPRVSYVSVEVGGTRTWEFDLDCSSARRLLNQTGEDQQGVSGKDLRYLIRNAWENGTNLTLYLANSVSYTVAIESEEARSPGYVNHQGSTVKADEEWLAHVVLRQVA